MRGRDQQAGTARRRSPPPEPRIPTYTYLHTGYPCVLVRLKDQTEPYNSSRITTLDTGTPKPRIGDCATCRSKKLDHSP